MRIYARIHDGAVAELVRTDRPIGQLFHPALTWLDVTGQPEVALGWRSDGKAVTPAAPTPPVAAASPSLADLAARIAELQADLAALRR